MTNSQAWLALLLAIGAEIAGTSLLKLSEGLTRPWPTVLLLLAYGCAIALVARVVTVIPLGITYAFWSGIGTLAVVLVGALVYRQFLSMSQMVGIALIVAGVIIVNLGGDVQSQKESSPFETLKINTVEHKVIRSHVPGRRDIKEDEILFRHILYEMGLVRGNAIRVIGLEPPMLPALCRDTTINHISRV